jgi:hypothetical protein
LKSVTDFFLMGERGFDVGRVAAVVVDGGYAVSSGWDPQLPVEMVVRYPFRVAVINWISNISSLSPKASGARL